MQKVSDNMNNWEALIKWFDFVKDNAGVRVDDNFKIESGTVFIDGQNLQLHMNKLRSLPDPIASQAPFRLQEGLCCEEEWLRLFDLSDMNCRMRIKSHLVNFLATL